MKKPAKIIREIRQEYEFAAWARQRGFVALAQLAEADARMLLERLGAL
jgi:hypothetical protein